MFDIGFWELSIIALVALIVIGPDKLPAVARNVGKWVGRTRRFVNQKIQQDGIRKALEEESGLGDIKQALDNEHFGFEEEKEYLVNAISDVDKQIKEEPVASSTEDKPAEPDNSTSDDKK